MSRNDSTSSPTFIEARSPTTHAFQIIGVTQSTTPEKIKKAYKAKVLLFHPDKTGTHDSAPQFCEVQEAYEVLQAANFPIVSNTWLQAQVVVEARAKMKAERQRWETDFCGAMRDYSTQVQERAFYKAWRIWGMSIFVIFTSMLFWIFVDYWLNTALFRKFVSGTPALIGAIACSTLLYGAFVQLHLYSIWARRGIRWAMWRLLHHGKVAACGDLGQAVHNCIDAVRAGPASVASAMTALILGQLCLCLTLRALYWLITPFGRLNDVERALPQ